MKISNNTKLAFYFLVAIFLFVYGLVLCVKNRDVTYVVFSLPLFALMMKVST